MQGVANSLERKKEIALAKIAAREAKQTESVAVVSETGVKKSRKKRGTFNGTEGKMTVAIDHIPGKHLHWLNDEKGRIPQALDNGYEFVTYEEVGGLNNNNATSRNTDLGDNVRILVGRDDNNGPLFAYLMKIDQEWYDEDQSVTQERNDKVDTAIRGGKLVGDGQSTEGFYVPKGGIKLET